MYIFLESNTSDYVLKVVLSQNGEDEEHALHCSVNWSIYSFVYNKSCNC